MNFCISLTLILLHCLTAVVPKDRNKNPGSKRISPYIIAPLKGMLIAKIGEPLELTCKAKTGRRRHFTIIYWLANDQFIEDRYTDGRVTEEKERYQNENGMTLVQKNLKFTQTEQEDFEVIFTCVVQNTVGTAVKNVALGKSADGVILLYKINQIVTGGLDSFCEQINQNSKTLTIRVMLSPHYHHRWTRWGKNPR